MSVWKKIGESVKKAGKTIAEEIKTRQEIAQTKRRILDKFEMNELEKICKDYGIGEPSPYEEDFITGERSKITLTREDYIDWIIDRLTLEQIKNFANKHRIDIWDIIKEERKRDNGCSPKVIATGGLAVLMADRSRWIEIHDPDLTLKGLKILIDKNR